MNSQHPNPPANLTFPTTDLRVVRDNGGNIYAIQRLLRVQDGFIHKGKKMPGYDTDYAKMNAGKKFVSYMEGGGMIHVPTKEVWVDLPSITLAQYNAEQPTDGVIQFPQ